jgi:hypothetical protein
MDKFLTWALIILVAIIVLFSSFSISLDNSSSSSKKLGLMNNSINNSTGDGGILNSIYSRKPTEKAGLGTPVGAKFYAPKCG